jgi:hypothetical protein
MVGAIMGAQVALNIWRMSWADSKPDTATN